MTAAATAAPIPEGYVEVKVLAYAREYNLFVPVGGGVPIEISTTTATSPTTLISIDDILTAAGVWEDQLQAAGLPPQVVVMVSTLPRLLLFNLTILDTQTMNGFTIVSLTFTSTLPRIWWS